eukprot:6423597-Amphidinium_carterae.1
MIGGNPPCHYHGYTQTIGTCCFCIAFDCGGMKAEPRRPDKLTKTTCPDSRELYRDPQKVNKPVLDTTLQNAETLRP